MAVQFAILQKTDDTLRTCPMEPVQKAILSASSALNQEPIPMVVIRSSPGQHKGVCFLAALFFVVLLLLPCQLWAGEYLDSAHGSTLHGVKRPSIDSAGYARGNCAHCHEQHASIDGAEPEPSSGTPSPFALFTTNFDSSKTLGPYSESDNFCFYCHNATASIQVVTNYDYSQNFGCAGLQVSSIMDAFNQASYHNLYDIWSFARSSFSSWFTNGSNPCNACHNPHLARRNWAYPSDPLYSAISKPTDHFNLWGTTSLMSAYSYESPYCSGTSREPTGSGASNGGSTPDYVSFCTNCHNPSNTIYSTSLGRDLVKIDWSSQGDKHGARNMDGGLDIEGPYGSSGGYVLSCLDCHEPHGSSNILLIRRRVNGGDLHDSITTYSTNYWGYLCTRCHLDDYDANAGTKEPYRWRYVHHEAPDHPYTAMRCGQCHGGGSMPIPCTNCHYHGAVDSRTGLINF